MQRPSVPRVRYIRTSDGVQIAWSATGRGPVLVRVGGWLTHMEYDVKSPVWHHWVDSFSEHFTFVRYDERGCGMTDWTATETSLDRSVADLEEVVAAVGSDAPLCLLGIAHGAAIAVAYASKHPNRVSTLILYGGFAQGWARRNDPDGLRQYNAIIEVVGSGWASKNAAFRRLFASRFLPEATESQVAWFNDFCIKATSAAGAVALLRSRAALDVTQLLNSVSAQTLVAHARGDEAVPIAQGRMLAAGIKDAAFVELDSNNHILLPHEDAWAKFRDVVLEFAGSADSSSATSGRSGRVEHLAFTRLSPREREILKLLTEGLSNAEIGEQLKISDKTVRNHVSNLYDKLGVWTRAQAMVFAHDHGFNTGHGNSTDPREPDRDKR